ncbi:three-Cys-motif partner protein TcmP [bacterium]|nr:MAG: three-Cys-motif partner protein TcmP [bacterium]
MSYKDLHEEPFDDSTIAKLEIFEDYAQAWLPTFIMQGVPKICIFDFFAGTGYDKIGIAGSPIRILEQIKVQLGHVFQKKTKIEVYLNEFEPNKKKQNKFELLKRSCSNYLNENKDVERAIEIHYLNHDFEEIFPLLLSKIRDFPSLVYLDQNGIKFLSDKYFLELEKTRQTDFLYFVSASYFWRFGENLEFKMHLDIDMTEAKKHPYKFIHRSIIEQLRKKLPTGTKLKLYPFSLKKGANIYGIIFGASHPFAVDKFLTIAWRRNETNGQANFDIDEDAQKEQVDMFFGKKLTKVEDFKQNVRRKVLNREIINNFQLYDFALEEGHIGTHAAECLKHMKKNNEITYDGISPLVTYDNVYNQKRQLEYKRP